MANDNAKIDMDKLKNSLRNVVNEEITFKENISLNEWLELKKAVYPINNYITTELTIKFIDKLKAIFKNTPDVVEKIRDVDLQSLKEYYGKLNVNSNGYDFIAPIPSNEQKKKNVDIPKLNDSFPSITAEVKANIPYKGKKYGSSQKTGLEKDIRGLIDPKEKHLEKDQMENPKSKDVYKFLVVLDYNLDGKNSKEAVEDLISDKKYVEKIELDNPPIITKDNIYIVALDFDDK